MAYTDTLLTNEQDDVLMMTPDAAEFDDEGSGATSGYGDTTEDDLGLTDDEDDDLDDPLEADPDEELQDGTIDEDDDL